MHRILIVHLGYRKLCWSVVNCPQNEGFSYDSCCGIPWKIFNICWYVCTLMNNSEVCWLSVSADDLRSMYPIMESCYQFYIYSNYGNFIMTETAWFSNTKQLDMFSSYTVHYGSSPQQVWQGFASSIHICIPHSKFGKFLQVAYIFAFPTASLASFFSIHIYQWWL